MFNSFSWSGRVRWVIALIGAGIVAVLLGTVVWPRWGSDPAGGTKANGGMPGGRESRPVPATVESVLRRDFEVVQSGLGTVTALNTVTVKPRVDGLLQKIHFREGALVREGEVLAELDARPFQIAVEQARGQWMRDQAQLNNARMDLSRYQGLQDKEAVSRQQVDTQLALVQQLEGVVKLDQAQLDNALLQLDFSQIKAPVSGRLGIRQVDLGNMVKSADSAGLVVLTQTQPISVVFALPSDSVPEIMARWLAASTGTGKKGGAEALKVEAWSRDNRERLAHGKLLTVDNQLDPSTGTVKLKAVFENTDNRLFPNQFVNVRLFVETLKNATLIPEAALQRGTQGAFVYQAKAGEQNKADGPPMAQVKLQTVKVGPSREGWVVIEDGLKPGDQVVVDGLDKLRDGGQIIVAPAKGEKKGKNR